MNTKTPICKFFADKLPSHKLDPGSRPNLLVFRRRFLDRIYECVAIQRDSISNGLAPHLAVTYSSYWQGESASPLGINRGFPQLRRNEQLVEAIENWYFYRPHLEGLNSTLQTILADFQQLGIPFFESARKQLLGDKMLQAALRAAEAVTAEQRIGLPESLAEVGHFVARCKHPAFLVVRDRIRAAWTDDIPKEQRQWTSRLAYDVLTSI